MYNTVMAFEDVDFLADADIAIEILLALLMQRSPGAKVTPTEVRRTDKDLLGLLHNGIVNRDIFAFREEAVDLFLLFLRFTMVLTFQMKIPAFQK